MADNKNMKNQTNTLSEEELDQVSGGVVNELGVVTNPGAELIGTAEPMKPNEKKPSLFQQNCG